MKKSTFAILALFLLGSLGCSDQKQALDEITIGTFSTAIDYSPYYIAKHFQWFENSEELKGAKIIYQQYTDRSAFATQLKNNSLNVLFAAEPPIILTKAEGCDLKIVNVSCILQQEILIRDDLNIATPLDLKGRSIAVLAGTSSQYGLFKTLSDSQMSLNDVNIKTMNPIAARAEFEKGTLDAWAIWPPFVEEQEFKGNGKTLKGGDAIIQSIVVMPNKTITDYPEVTAEIIKIIDNAKKWIEENPQKAMSIVAKEMEIEIDVVELAWKKHLWGAKLSNELIEDLQDKANFLAEQEMTRNNEIVNIEDIVYWNEK